MNQDQVKALLHALWPETGGATFTVVFSGKKSARVNGLYKPATREIIIHNRNFYAPDGAFRESGLIYTAIHELAHHVICMTAGARGKAHSSAFWATFHDLLAAAEASGAYTPPPVSEELAGLISDIKDMLAQIVEIQERVGQHLSQVQTLCQREGHRYEDIVDRNLGMLRRTAKLYHAMKLNQVPTEYGPDGARLVVASKNGEIVGACLSRGATVDQARRAAKGGDCSAAAPLDPDEQERRKAEVLRKERARLEKTIQMLERRLSAVEQELGDITPAEA
jgi:hypothetical protein